MQEMLPLPQEIVASPPETQGTVFSGRWRRCFIDGLPGRPPPPANSFRQSFRTCCAACGTFLVRLRAVGIGQPHFFRIREEKIDSSAPNPKEPHPDIPWLETVFSAPQKPCCAACGTFPLRLGPLGIERLHFFRIRGNEIHPKEEGRGGAQRSSSPRPSGTTTLFYSVSPCSCRVSESSQYPHSRGILCRMRHFGKSNFLLPRFRCTTVEYGFSPRKGSQYPHSFADVQKPLKAASGAGKKISCDTNCRTERLKFLTEVRCIRARGGGTSCFDSPFFSVPRCIANRFTAKVLNTHIPPRRSSLSVRNGAFNRLKLRFSLCGGSFRTLRGKRFSIPTFLPVSLERAGRRKAPRRRRTRAPRPSCAACGTYEKTHVLFHCFPLRGGRFRSSAPKRFSIPTFPRRCGRFDGNRCGSGFPSVMRRHLSFRTVSKTRGVGAYSRACARKNAPCVSPFSLFRGPLRAAKPQRFSIPTFLGSL